MSKGRPRAFDQQTALEQALEVFWRHGYDATSIAMLTEALGIRPPSLYAAFGDKRALFSKALTHYLQTHGAFTTDALAQEPTARAAVDRLLHEAALRYTDPAHPPGCLVISAAVNHTPDSEDVEAELRVLRQAGKQAIAHRIQADKAAGHLPADTDTKALATFYATVIQGMSRQAQDGATPEDLTRAADLAMTTWPNM